MKVNNPSVKPDPRCELVKVEALKHKDSIMEAGKIYEVGHELADLLIKTKKAKKPAVKKKD